MRPTDPKRLPRTWQQEFARESLQNEWGYVRRLLITLVIVGLAYFLWLISGILLLFFAAVLLAVLLSFIAALITRYTPVPPAWALTVAVLLASSSVLGFLVLFGSQVAGQIAEVVQMLPQAIDAAGRRVGIEDAAARLEQAVATGASSGVLSRMTGLGYTVLSALADLALVLVAAVYLAADPGLYRRGAAKLLPPSQHARLFALDATKRCLN